MLRRLASTAAVAVALLALAACSPDRAALTPSAQETTSAAPSSTADAGVYSQSIQWSTCGDLECGSIKVPLDWSDPSGDQITINLNRHPATGTSMGSLVINPGGPGASGLDFTDYFTTFAGKDLLQNYDIVSFDPRGVGTSSPLNCGDTQTLNDYLITDHEILTQADVDASLKRDEAFAQGCLADSGPIVKNMDTVSVAKDLDVIRAVLGDQQLHYFGFSYGTQLGATYAELFPQNVGRMVLDGAVDFLLPAEESSIAQATGFENALGNYIAWCQQQSDCPLSADAAKAKQQIHDIAFNAIKNPVPGNGTQVNGNLMVYGIIVTLYDQGSWKYLTAALNEVMTQNTATIMAQLADFYLDRDSETGDYNSNESIAFPAISCLDEVRDGTWDIARVNDFRAKVEKASPTFGWWFGNSTGCDGWPFEAQQKVTSLDAASASAPILVLGTTHDPATPYQWAQSLTKQLGNATLLTYQGEGHTAYRNGNACVTSAVDGYLVGGVMPDAGTTC